MKKFARILELITALSALAAAVALYLQVPNKTSESTAAPTKEVAEQKKEASEQKPSQFDFRDLARNLIKSQKPTELSTKKPSFQHASNSPVISERRTVTQPTRPVYVPEVQSTYRPTPLPSKPARASRSVEEPAETEEEEPKTYSKPRLVFSVSQSQTQTQTQTGGGTQTQSQSQGTTVIYRRP